MGKIIKKISVLLIALLMLIQLPLSLLASDETEVPVAVEQTQEKMNPDEEETKSPDEHIDALKSDEEQEESLPKETMKKTTRADEIVYDDIWLQEQINNVASYGTITLTDDVILNSTVTIPDKKFTIDGDGHAIKLASGFTDRHFSINGNVAFANLTMQGHNTGSPGKTNEGRIAGGGMVSNRGRYITINFNNCTLQGIHPASGGSVVELGNTPVVFNNCILTQNSTDGSAGGGVIYSNNNTVEMIDTIASYNSSYAGSGGVVSGPYGTRIFNGCTFEYNYAKGSGGVIGITNGDITKLEITKSKFNHNEAGIDGGAVYCNSSNMKFAYCDFFGNKSGGDGGAVCQWGKAEYIGGSFIENESLGTRYYGGAIALVNNQYMNFFAEDTHFADNRAKVDGRYWDVENPKYAPIAYDQLGSIAEHYKENVKNINTFSDALDESVTYTNVYNNHDVTFRTSFAVLFIKDEDVQPLEKDFSLHGNNQPLTPPEGYTEAEGKIFLGWEIINGTINGEPANLGWIPKGWPSGEPYMWDDDTMEVTGSLALVGRWADEAILTYHLNDGSDALSPYSHAKDSDVTLLSLRDVNQDWIAPQGKTFAGWDTQKNGEGTRYNAGDEILLTGNRDLYAQWELENYTLTFDSKGGSSVAEQTVKYNEVFTEPTAPTKTGHTFVGWYTDEALNNEYDFATPATQDITLYAKWDVVTDPTDPTDPTKPDTKPPTKNTEVAKTSDNNNIIFPAILLCISVVGLGGLTFALKSSKKGRHRKE